MHADGQNASSHKAVRIPCVSCDDWTDLLPDTEHARYFVQFDWAATLLGPLHVWNLVLRLNTIRAFGDPRPSVIYWGPTRIAIYNDAFIFSIGEKHPECLGQAFADTFPEIVPNIFPLFQAAEETRQTQMIISTPLTVQRNNFAEETFFDGSFVPLTLQDGTVGGIFNTAHDVTRRALNDRRTQMLNLISASSDQMTSRSVYVHIAACLRTNELDIPFALLFMASTSTDFNDVTASLELIDSLGLPPAGEISHQYAKLQEGIGFVPFLGGGRTEINTVEIDETRKTTTWNQITWGGHGEPSQYMTTIPLSGAGRTYGYLVVGNNPRRRVDRQYEQFMSDIQRHATAAVAATIGSEEAEERNQRLQDQLFESERQIRYMAQHSDIGMMQLALDGSLIWANEHYHRATGGQDNGQPRQTFIADKELLENDRRKATDLWQLVLQGNKVEAVELQFIRTYTPPSGSSVPITVLLSAFPYREHGRIKSIMACMTEISRLKWAESWQAQVAHDAKEAKRLQSEFTDAISHEIRNPLSAILMLANSITDSLVGGGLTREEAVKRLEENVESAQTILSCAQHQKQIVDDVLTLSRMDFGSIVLSPGPVRPVEIIQKALHMVEADVKANAITLQTIEKPSLNKYASDLVMCDSLRVVQILLNLLSNAVKFTKMESRRSIIVTYGAATSEPASTFPTHVTWSRRRQDIEDATLGAEWGVGDQLYMTFMVEDSGPGMTSDEISRVFDKFEQATPKTSIKYGGSGLGLYISHRLTERHNGAIGVASSPGKGSIFVFYVKARRLPTESRRLSNGFSPKDRNGQSVARDEAPAMPTPGPLGKPNNNKTVVPILLNTFHLLLVEDNLINQKVLSKQLTKAGCTVHVANHGLEALEFLRTSSLWAENGGKGLHLDAILMDLEMPVMDGLTCVREIRRLEASGSFTSHPQVIAVTANVRADHVRTAKEAGMNLLVAKPFVVTELLDLITKQLNG